MKQLIYLLVGSNFHARLRIDPLLHRNPDIVGDSVCKISLPDHGLKILFFCVKMLEYQGDLDSKFVRRRMLCMNYLLRGISVKKIKVCIDNITKMIYNIKRLLYILAKNTNKKSCVGLTAATLLFFSTFSVGSTGRDGAVSLELGVFISDDRDLIEVIILNPDERELCALSAVLEYDPSLVSFASAEAGESFAGGFSFVNEEGCVKLLLDKGENVSERELARICFSVNDKARIFKAEFRLFPLGTISACRFFENTAVPVSLIPAVGSVLSLDESDKVRSSVAATVLTKDGFALLSLESYIFCEGFAAGFEVSLVKLDVFKTERFCTVGALPISKNDAETFERTVSVPDEGNVCVIVRPVIYDKSGAVYGKEKVFVIIDGYICG